MLKLFKIFSIVILSLSILSSDAQVYPVQGSATLIPPYALRLSDYATSISERLVVNTLLADVTKAELHVRFKVSIVGQNVKLETKPEYIGTPITLQGGIPLRLTNIELAEYFDPNHLNFSGISKNDFLKTGFLPEGFYQFCFEVYEYNRGVKISNTICAPAWLILNDPPMINLPRSGDKLKPLTPQNVILQWTPRHTGSPNSAFTTEYDVKVVEVWPANRNPNDAILTQPAIYETTTHSTTLVYGPDATQLEPGRVYAFRVQARSMAGAEQLDLFKNNGYSETVTFIYGDACDAPSNIAVEASAPSRVSLSWNASPSQTGYTVQYRVKGQTDGKWYSSSSLFPSVDISDLQPNTTYEYQAMSTCGSFESAFGDIASVTTPDASQKGYTCGVPIENFNLDPSQLIPVLKVGDVVNAGDFDVTITRVSGANGIFSGEGAVVIPFMNQVKGLVKFDNITVNNDKRMVAGFMNITGGGIQVVPTGVLNAMEQLSQTMSMADSVLNVAREFLTPPPSPSNFVPDQVVNVPAGISKVYTDVATGSVIVVDKNGKSQSIPLGSNLAVTDGSGGGVIVDKKGGVNTNVSAGDMASIVKRENNLNLRFTRSNDTRYGIDIQKVDPLKKNYELLGDNYYVPFKAVALGKSDVVSASLISPGIDLNKIKFDQGGTPVNATISGQSITLNVNTTSSQEEGNVPLVARIIDETTKKETILGKLNIVGYDSQALKLHFISVNGAKISVSASDIQAQLNLIYSQAATSWAVDMGADLKVDGLATPFDNGSSGILSAYTGDMKTVINTYLKNTSLGSDDYYLFLVPKGTNTTEDGYMPRSKQCGFIFLNGQENDPARIARTMAHELGHGAFTLQHTFSDYTGLAQGSTDNLMDYGNGTNLWKYQWHTIHSPRIVLGVFQSDESAASYTCLYRWFESATPSVDCDDVGKLLDKIKKAISSSLKISFAGPSTDGKDELITSSIKLDDIEYKAIRIKNFVKQGGSVTVDPFTSEDYNPTSVSSDQLPGISFVADGKVVFRISVDDVSVEAAKLKRDELRKYLFFGPCTSGFCCTKCGRDLTISQERLKEIFPYSTLARNNVEFSTIFNYALKNSGFTTCDRQAKLFAQIGHESAGFNSKVEGQNANGVDMDWEIGYMLNYFKRTLGAKQHFFNQNFWDSKAYKEIITSDYFEAVTASGTHKPQSYKDYYGVYNDQNQDQYHIKIPADFKADATGLFKVYNVPAASKAQNRKNMFTQAYDGVLGNVLISVNPATEDGWKYRGRGAIQLTGRRNYETNKTAIFNKFNEVFDFVTTPDLLATSNRAAVLSAVAFVLQNVSKIDELDSMTIDQFSALVNTGNSKTAISNVNGADDRRARYKNLIDDFNLFKCEK